jgi:ribosomal protein S18 acetylase RimI-like enzyme
MNFEYQVESIRTPALSMDYHLVPWDSDIFGQPVAQISQLRITDAMQAHRDYQPFARWCSQHAIQLCACRIPAGDMVESMFLEDQGFRFVELNYLPVLTRLQERSLESNDIQVTAAETQDREALADMAEATLLHGRFHQDPRIDPALGGKRYRAWMRNAFTRSTQQVLKCLLDGAIVGFFVVEQPQPTHCFWSLTGLAPGLQGRGLGKRVWNAVLDHHRRAGMELVSTSISSHNVAVFNLYVSLGFRFPAPSITLQWRPPGAGVLS